MTGSRPVCAGDLDAARDLHRAGRLEAALHAYADIIAADSASVTDVATAHNNSCVILLDRGDFHEAGPHCSRAVELRRELGDTRRLARALNNKALLHQNIGDYVAAGAAYDEALELNRDLGDVAAEAVNLANLGWLATQSAQYSRALSLQESVMDLARAHSEAPWAARQMQLAQLNQGVTLERLGAYREALEMYRRLLDEGAALAPAHRVSLQVNLGVVYRNLGDPVSALAMFEEARDAYRILGDRAGLGNVLLNIGLVHDMNLDRPDAAHAAYEEALGAARDSGDTEAEVQSLCFLGHLQLKQASWEESQELFETARTLASASDTGEGRWNALYGLARVAMARGRPQDALPLLEQAMLEIESIRSGIDRGRLRAGFFGERRSAYALAVDALAALLPDRASAAEEAFAVIQRAKARELLDAVGAGSGRRLSVDVSELQGTLGEAVLVEYFDAGSIMYRLTVTRDEVRLRSMGDARRISAEVGELYNALSRRLVIPEPATEGLSRILFEDDLADAGETIWIAPDRALHYLPFEMLPKTTSGGVPLIETNRVAYLPSASFLTREVRSDGPAKVFAGFGDPVLQTSTSDGPDPRRLLVNQFDLQPLPGSGRELADVAILLGDSGASQSGDPAGIHVGAEATESRFRDSVRDGSRVVHIATHTVIDNGASRSAAVVLSADESDDGLLYPEEIANMEYHAMLTVLAACRSAFGSEVGGYGLGTLGGAFMAAGSESVLVTLWDIGDAATAAFMEQFYFFLSRGQAPATALRAAKNRLRSRPGWSDPALWAGYVLIGDSAPVRDSRSNALPIAIAVAGPLLILLGWYYLKRIRSASNSSVST